MRHGVRQLIVYLTAAFFVLNGVALHAYTKATAAQTHHSTVSGANYAAASHVHRAGDGGDVAKEFAPRQSHDHLDPGEKCCSMCVVFASVMPESSANSLRFAYADVAFLLIKRELAGHLVALDPDIPKAIV